MFYQSMMIDTWKKYYLSVYLDNCVYKIANKQMNLILMTNVLKIRYYKWCITTEMILAKELILLKAATATNVWFVLIDFLITHGFECPDSVYNGCHDLTMLSVNISSIVINTVKNVDYRCIIHNTSKPEAINLSKNSVLGDCGYI